MEPEHYTDDDPDFRQTLVISPYAPIFLPPQHQQARDHRRTDVRSYVPHEHTDRDAYNHSSSSSNKRQRSRSPRDYMRRPYSRGDDYYDRLPPNAEHGKRDNREEDHRGYHARQDRRSAPTYPLSGRVPPAAMSPTYTLSGQVPPAAMSPIHIVSDSIASVPLAPTFSISSDWLSMCRPYTLSKESPAELVWLRTPLKDSHIPPTALVRETSNLPSLVDFSTRQKLLMLSISATKKALGKIQFNHYRLSCMKANPCAFLRNTPSPFTNRNAMLLANIDAVCNVTTQWPGEILFFADLCADSGGFSEYLMWRRQSSGGAIGFSLSLRQSMMAPEKFTSEIVDAAANLTVSYGADKTGDLTKVSNIAFYAKETLIALNGVHLVVASGSGDRRVVIAGEEVHELQLKRVLLAEIITMSLILRKGGSFVVKIFDLHTPFTVGLLFILHCWFDEITIMKPEFCDVESTEKYVVCKGFSTNSSVNWHVIDHLTRLNAMYAKLYTCPYAHGAPTDLTQIIDPKHLNGSQQRWKPFAKFIRKVNENAALFQKEALESVLFLADANQCPADEIIKARQTRVMKEKLAQWNIK